MAAFLWLAPSFIGRLSHGLLVVPARVGNGERTDKPRYLGCWLRPAVAFPVRFFEHRTSLPSPSAWGRTAIAAIVKRLG